MLSRKLTLMLSAAAITLMVCSIHTSVAGDAAPAPRSKVSDRWLNREPQKTTAQEAAEAARKARMDEMKQGIASKEEPAADTKVTPAPAEKEPTASEMESIKSPTHKKMIEQQKAEEAKPAEAKKMETTPAPQKEAAVVAPAKKRLTLHEQIALNKKKKAEELRKIQEENKAARAMPSKKPMHAHAKATPTPHKPSEAMPKEPVVEHLPPVTLEMPHKAKTPEAMPKEPVVEHMPPVTLKMPLKVEQHPDKVEAVDKSEKSHFTLGKTQDRIMAQQKAQEEKEAKTASTASSPDRGDLLAQIREGKKLRAVKKDEPNANQAANTNESASPKADVAANAKPQNLQDELRNKLLSKGLKQQSESPEAAAAG